MNSIRTLLVDDEPIVRKGLMHIMPWGRYGFEIAADVDSGSKALDRLAQEPFDLLVTDLSMPGMDGFQLIQETKKKYPALAIVILTCHQDFQYVQEALRLGALDYIVKTELEEEKLDAIFGRIAAALREPPASVSKTESAPARKGTLFLGLRADCSLQELVGLPWIGDGAIRPVADCDRAWYVESEAADTADPSSLALPEAPRWLVVRLHQVVHRQSLLPRYVKRHAFYSVSLRAGEPVFSDSLLDISKLEDKPGDMEWLDCWRRSEWLFDNRAWERLAELIEQARPDPAALAAELFNAAASWTIISRSGALADCLETALSLAVWEDWRDWLYSLRESLRAALDSRGAGEEIAVRVLQAIHDVRGRIDQGVTQEDAASAVHLSRGYFSDCFKRTAGCTFNEYMKEFRLDRAARLLATTELDVQDVALKCGFTDEFYFRKLFKESHGCTPKEFRQRTSPRAYALSIVGPNDREKIVRPDSTIVRQRP